MVSKAEAAETLSETFPDDLVNRSWLNHVALTVIPGGIFFLFIYVFIATELSSAQNGQHPWITAALFAGPLLALFLSSCLVFTSVLHYRLRTNLPSVEWSSDKITLRIANQYAASAKISECRIRRGRAYQMRISAVPMGITMYCWFPVILIDLPPLNETMVGTYVSNNTLAVGLNQEMLAKWECALTPYLDKPWEAAKSTSAT